MFLVLSKSLDLLAAPLTWAAGLFLLGIVLHKRRAGRPLAAAGLAVLLIFSWEPAAGRLERLAEHDAPMTYQPGTMYDAVILLGGVIDPAAMARSGQLELMESGDRLVQTESLLRHDRAKSVLISGGLIYRRAGESSEAAQLAAYLRDQGIAADRIFVEEKSRNTRENAIESARIVRQRGWTKLLLITSAWHAKRALGCFRAVGLTPDVLPVDHRATDGSDYGWFPRAGALNESTDAMREFLGRLVYWMMGYSR